jgi:hypothetical protein
MSPSKNKNHKAGRRSASKTTHRRIPYLPVAVFAIIAIVAIFVIYALRQGAPGQSAVSGGEDANASANGSPAGFENLIGRWLRPDGGYVIQIQGVDAGGEMDAVYLNPRPINVSQAKASWKDGKQQVFIELRDTGYPGSTYTLVYHPQEDMLSGLYYQAVVKNNFEVIFVRQQ